MIIVHLCLACFYVEGMSYQENIMPKKHKELGYDVSIIASRYGFDKKGVVYYRDATTYTNADGIEVTVLDYSPSKKNAVKRRFYQGLFEALTIKKPDIIFCHGVQFGDSDELIRYKKAHPAVKIFADNHSDYINLGICNNGLVQGLKSRLAQTLIWKPSVKRLEQWVECFWGVAPLRVDFLIDVYKVNPNKVKLLVMGGDEEKINFSQKDEIRRSIRAGLEIPEDDFVMITGGKIGKLKQIHLLCQAVDELNLKNLHLLVFGEVMDEMIPAFEKYKNHANIHMLGWISTEKMYQLYLASDLAVFPGTHSVLWEQAAACGIPCMVKYWKGMNHIDVGGNCLFLHQDSGAEIKEMIADLLHNKDKFLAMKTIAMEKAAKEFSYIEIAKKAIDHKD